MQIRISKSGRKIQILKARYVPEKKRSTQDLVATFDSWKDELPDNGLDKLNEQEKKEVQTWLDKRKADRKEMALKRSINDISLDINRVIESITLYGVTNDQAQAVYTSIDNLTKSIRKAGFTRPKKEPPKPIEPPKPPQKKTTKKTVKKKAKKKTKKTSKKKTKK